MREKRWMNSRGEAELMTFRRAAPWLVSWRSVVKDLYAFMVISPVDHTRNMFPSDNDLSPIRFRARWGAFRSSSYMEHSQSTYVMVALASQTVRSTIMVHDPKAPLCRLLPAFSLFWFCLGTTDCF